jgi:hypothetical protein
MKFRHTGYLAVFCFGLLVGGCESTTPTERTEGQLDTTERHAKDDVARQTDADPFTQYIPKDTPFLLMGLKPLDPVMWKRLFSSVSAAIVDQDAEIEKALKESGLFETGSDSERLLVGLMLEAISRAKDGGIQSMGFSSRPRYALYGIGIAPVLRLELRNSGQFEAFIGAAMARAKVSVEQKTLNGQQYWLGTSQKVTGVLSLTKKQLIVSVLPSTLVDSLLPTILGHTKPEHALASVGTVPDLMKRRNFLGIAFGFLDISGIAKNLMTNTDSTLRRVIDGFGLAVPRTSSECKRDITRLVSYAQRLEFGFGSSSAKQLTNLTFLTSKAALTDGLERAAAYVPGLGSPNEASLSLGVGLNVGKMLAEIRQFLQTAQPLKCPEMAALNGLLETTKTFVKTKLSLLPPAMNGINGFYLEMTNLNFITKGGEQLSGFALLAAEQATALFRLAQVMLPPLAQIKLQPTGKAQDIELKKGILGRTVKPLGVLADNGMGFALGAAQTQRLESLIGQAPKKPGPFLSYGYHMGRLFAAFDTFRGRLRKAQGKADEKAVKTTSKNLGRLRVNISARSSEFVMTSYYELD